MGNNLWLKGACGVGLAIALSGLVSSAQAANLNGLKAIVDIPEIARTGGGKVTSSGGDQFAGIADEFGGDLLIDPFGTVPQDPELPDALAPGGNLWGHVDIPEIARDFVVLPRAAETAIGYDGLAPVPTPGSLALAALAAFGLGRRRRA